MGKDHHHHHHYTITGNSNMRRGSGIVVHYQNPSSRMPRKLQSIEHHNLAVLFMANGANSFQASKFQHRAAHEYTTAISGPALRWPKASLCRHRLKKYSFVRVPGVIANCKLAETGAMRGICNHFAECESFPWLPFAGEEKPLPERAFLAYVCHSCTEWNVLTFKQFRSWCS